MKYVRAIDVLPPGVKQGDPLWHQKRDRLVVSGTTVASLVPAGHPWHSKYTSRAMCLRRYVLGYSAETNGWARNAFAEGHRWEPVAIQRWVEQEAEEGRKVEIVSSGLLVSTENPVWGGSLDGIESWGKYIVEVKTLVSRKIEYDALGAPKVPGHYEAQAQWYMWLTGIPMCCFLQFNPATRQLFHTWVAYKAEEMDRVMAWVREYTEEAQKMREHWSDLVTGKWEEQLGRLEGTHETQHVPPMERLEALEAYFEEWKAAVSELAQSLSPAPRTKCPRGRRDTAEDAAIEKLGDLDQAAWEECRRLLE